MGPAVRGSSAEGRAFLPLDNVQLILEKGELFKLDGKPSFGEAFPQAMQHVLAMLVGNITPPMLIAGACGLSDAD